MNLHVSANSPDCLSAPTQLKSGLVDQFTLDMSNVRYVRPHDLVQWRCLIQLAIDLGMQYTILLPTTLDQRNYCGRMGLFDGTTYQYPLTAREPGSFFPLMRITSDRNERINEECQRVFTQSNATPNYVDSLAEAFTELADNIYWHAGDQVSQGSGFIQAQVYKTKGQIRIGLADAGVGFYQSYVRANQVRGRTEETIVREAFNLGESSLNPGPGLGRRGIGLHDAWEFVKTHTGWIRIQSGHSWATVTQRDMLSGMLTNRVDGTIIEMGVPIL